MTRRLLAPAVTAFLLLAGCSSGGPTTRAKPTVSAAVTSSSASAATATANPIAAAIDAGQYPACKLTVGLPTAEVVHGYDPTTKRVDVHCVTGSSTADDHTGAGMTPCNPLDPKSWPVYYWASQRTGNPDQSVYAAKQGGVVVVVPQQTADEFFSIPGGVASVLLATGVC